ncbi:TLD-domain-containing protein [Scleroderma citrinum]
MLHPQPSSIPPLIDLDSPISSPPYVSSSSLHTARRPPSSSAARPASHRPSPRSISRIGDQPRTPPPLPRHHLDESDIDRYAILFSPATPPGTPTHDSEQRKAKPPCQNRLTHAKSGSSDSEFGPFISVPPNQDPLAPSSSGSATPTMAMASPTASTTRSSVTSSVVGSTKTANTSLDYFGQFTTSARVASERSRKGVLDELLEHQDDPMYFLSRPSSTSPQHQHHTHHTHTSKYTHTHPYERTADGLLARKQSLSSLTGFPRTGAPLPPRLSSTATPPSVSSPSASGVSLPLPIGQEQEDDRLRAGREKGKESVHQSTWPPAHATLSRLSSSWVSAFLSGTRPSRSNTSSSTFLHSSASDYAGPSSSSSFTSSMITHGSPFASTPFIPPSGAPGFTGDRNWDKGFSDALLRERDRGTKGVNLCGRREGTAEVLIEELANLIRPRLPALVRLTRSWTLLYSIDQHGISLNTLYARCEPRIPSKSDPNPPKGAIVVVRDSLDGMFGAWVGEGIQRGRGGYYGSGEAFLWRYHPDASPPLEVYKWTGKNDYVVLCEPEFISFGGGDGHYGLYIDATLLDGSSAPCPTFDNPALCTQPPSQSVLGTGTKDVPFECVGLEVWGVGPG